MPVCPRTPIPSIHGSFLFRVTLRKVIILSSGFWNLSFINKGATGESGLWSWLGREVIGLNLRPAPVDAGVFVVLSVLLVYTLVVGRQAGKAMIFPVIMSAYFLPTLLTRNEQIYYDYEAFAAVALLVGTCLARGSQAVFRGWVIALVVVIANGTFSNYRSLYFWHEAANKVESVMQPLIEAHGGERLESITFVTSSVRSWQWALMAHSHGPLVPELMGIPGLRVTVMSPDELRLAGISSDGSNLVLDLDGGALSEVDKIRTTVRK